MHRNSTNFLLNLSKTNLMKLKVTCRNCREEFDLKKTYLTRPEMIDDLGEYFSYPCSHCATTSEYHVNDATAYSGGIASVVGIIAGILIMIISTLLFLSIGYISTIGYVIGLLIINASRGRSNTSNIRIFNSYKITRNPKT